MPTSEAFAQGSRYVSNRFRIRRHILDALAKHLEGEFEKGADWLFPPDWDDLSDFQKEIYNSYLEDAVELARKYLTYQAKQKKRTPCPASTATVR